MIIGANQGANSQRYWDDRFETNWEENRGRAYSRNYAELAFSLVPQWMIAEINRQALSLCDWGCAMGDGAAHLANLFPTAKVTGIDFAKPGIEKARENYPHVSFVCQNWLAENMQSDSVYDVVFSSHTLEHFGNPWSVIEALAARTGRALIFMVPFQEKDLIAEHCYSFQFENILFNPCEDLDLAYCEVIDDGIKRNNCWNGRQILLIYLRRNDPLWKGMTLADTNVATSLSDRTVNELTAGLREAEAKLGRLEVENRAKLARLAVEQRAKLTKREAELKEKLRRLESRFKEEKRKTVAARNSLRRVQDWNKTLESSIRFRIGNAIVGFGSWFRRLLNAPVMLFRRPQAEISISSNPVSTKNRKERSGTAEKRVVAAAKVGNVSGGDRCSTSKAYVDDLSTIDVQAVRERDIGYLFPPIVPPERPAPKVRAASVLDEFSDQCFRYEADLVRITPENWFDQFEEKAPKFLLVESAWHGNRDSWRKMIQSCNDVEDNELVHLVEFCKSQQIPTVFWNKEDPPNFEHFIDAAGLFDHVFTSDRESIPRYRELLGHDRIKALPFAAQPQIHNPIGKRDSPLLEVGFAGTWYAGKHEDRRELLRFLLDASRDCNLHIFDRMSEHTANDNYLYPERFTPFLHTALPYDHMVRAYRDFRLFLNVNSVLDSSTMLARRVFELLACQTNVVSTTSLAIERMLGNVVSVVDNEQEAREAIRYLLDNELARIHRAHLGWRKVMREHTYEQRFRTIAETIGVATAADERHPLVSVLVRDREHGDLDRLLDALHRQTYPNLEILVAGPQGGQVDGRLAALAANRANVQALKFEDTENLKQALAGAAREARGRFLTLFDARDRYGADFVWDLVTTLSYSGTDSVGKASHYTAPASGEQAGLVFAQDRLRHVDRVPTRAFLARRSLLTSEGGWRLDEDENLCAPTGSDNQQQWSFSSDAFNYLRNGYCAEVLPTGPSDTFAPMGSLDV